MGRDRQVFQGAPGNICIFNSSKKKKDTCTTVLPCVRRLSIRESTWPEKITIVVSSFLRPRDCRMDSHNILFILLCRCVKRLNRTLMTVSALVSAHSPIIVATQRLGAFLEYTWVYVTSSIAMYYMALFPRGGTCPGPARVSSWWQRGHTCPPDWLTDLLTGCFSLLWISWTSRALGISGYRQEQRHSKYIIVSMQGAFVTKGDSVRTIRKEPKC